MEGEVRHASPPPPDVIPGTRSVSARACIVTFDSIDIGRLKGKRFELLGRFAAIWQSPSEVHPTPWAPWGLGEGVLTRSLSCTHPGWLSSSQSTTARWLLNTALWSSPAPARSLHMARGNLVAGPPPWLARPAPSADSSLATWPAAAAVWAESTLF